MKKIFTFLLGLIFIILVSEAGFWIFSLTKNHHPVGPNLKNNNSILIIGNSYTAGPLVSPNEIYSKIIEKKVGHLYNVVNISDVSMNTTLIKERLNSLIALNPKIVFLMIGQPNGWNFYGFNSFLNQTSFLNDKKNFLLSILSKYSKIFSFYSYSLYQINQAQPLEEILPLQAFHFINKIKSHTGTVQRNYRSKTSSLEIATFFINSKNFLSQYPGNINLREKRIVLAANLNFPLSYSLDDLNQLTCYGKCYSELAENALSFYFSSGFKRNSKILFLNHEIFSFFKPILGQGIFLERGPKLISSPFYTQEKTLPENSSRNMKWIYYLINQMSILKSSPKTQKIIEIRNSIELTTTLNGFNSDELFIKEKQNLIELFTNHLNLIDRPLLYITGANALFQMGENDLGCLTLYRAIEEYPFDFRYSFKDALSARYSHCSKRLRLSLEDKLKRLKQIGFFKEFSPFSSPNLESIQNWRHHDIAFIVNFFNSIGAKVILQTYLPRRNDNFERVENDPINQVAKEYKIDLIDHFNEVLKAYPNTNDRDIIYLQGRFKGTTDDHFSGEGHQIVAKRILEYLQKNNYIKSTSSKDTNIYQ